MEIDLKRFGGAIRFAGSRLTDNGCLHRCDQAFPPEVIDDIQYPNPETNFQCIGPEVERVPLLRILRDRIGWCFQNFGWDGWSTSWSRKMTNLEPFKVTCH